MTVADLPEIISGILRYDGPFFAFLLLLAVFRARRLMRFGLLFDEMGSLKRLVNKRQSWSEAAQKLTLERIDAVNASILEQSKVLARVRASATVSEHLDVIEKVVLVSEQLEKIKQSVSAAFVELIDHSSAASQDRVREIHGQYKTHIEQTRKNLEKSVGDKVSTVAGNKGHDELMGQLVNPIRHALLSASKQNLNGLQTFSKAAAEDSERNIRESLSKACAAIEELRRKYDEAPLLLAGVENAKERSPLAG